MVYNIYKRNIYEILGKGANVTPGMSEEEKKKLFEMGEKSGIRQAQTKHKEDIEKYSDEFKSFQLGTEDELQTAIDEHEVELEKAKKDLIEAERIADLNDEGVQKRLRKQRKNIEILRENAIKEKENALKQKEKLEGLKLAVETQHNAGISKGLKIGRLEGLMKSLTPFVARKHDRVLNTDRTANIEKASLFYDVDESLAYIGMRPVDGETVEDLSERIIYKHRELKPVKKGNVEVGAKLLSSTYYPYTDDKFQERKEEDASTRKSIKEIEAKIGKKEMKIHNIDEEIEVIRGKKDSETRPSISRKYLENIKELAETKKTLIEKRINLENKLQKEENNFADVRMGNKISDKIKTDLKKVKNPLEGLFGGVVLGPTARVYTGIKIAQLLNPEVFSDQNIYDHSTREIKSLLTKK